MKRLAPLALLLALAGFAPAPAGATDLVFTTLSAEILEGIAGADVKDLPSQSGYGAPRIAIKPLKGGEGYDRRLLAELQALSQGRFDFVSRDGLDDLIEEIEAEGLGPEETEERIHALRAQARADVLISGRLSRDGDAVLLSYQAVATDSGRLLAATQPRRVGETKRPAGRHRRSVEEAEILLAGMGYDPGPVDGVLTRETRDALRSYQADSALPINGRLTRRVVENLRRDRR